MVSVITIAGALRGVPGAAKDGDILKFPLFTSSVKTSPCIEDKSEPLEGDRDRLRGKVIGSRYWGTLGSFVGAGGEPDGVEVLGDLEGVLGTITDTLSFLGINSRLFS